MESNSVRVNIYEFEEVEDPMGTIKNRSLVETKWAKKIYISIDGRDKFQQIGHGDVDFYLRFSHSVDISLSNSEFGIIEGGEEVYYEAIQPPEQRGLISRRATKIAVKEVAGDE